MKLIKHRFKIWNNVYDVYEKNYDGSLYFQNVYTRSWITPIHQKYRSYPISIPQLFQFMYSEHLSELVNIRNPFMEMLLS